MVRRQCRRFEPLAVAFAFAAAFSCLTDSAVVAFDVVVVEQSRLLLTTNAVLVAVALEEVFLARWCDAE